MLLIMGFKCRYRKRRIGATELEHQHKVIALMAFQPLKQTSTSIPLTPLLVLKSTE